MRRPNRILLFCCFLAIALSASGATGRVIKVLPQLLDLKGRHAKSPDLYQRDAYQAYLRDHPKEVSGLRFAIQWKARGDAAKPLKLRIDAIGTARGELPAQTVLEKEVEPGGWFSHWISVPLTGAEYEKLGALTAWRVSLWEGDVLLSEQKSFLW